jgi:hypothetical protein
MYSMISMANTHCFESCYMIHRPTTPETTPPPLPFRLHLPKGLRGIPVGYTSKMKTGPTGWHTVKHKTTEPTGGHKHSPKIETTGMTVHMGITGI